MTRFVRELLSELMEQICHEVGRGSVKALPLFFVENFGGSIEWLLTGEE